MGQSFSAAQFRGFVEIVCEGELTRDAFDRVVDEVGLFNIQLPLKEFLSMFSLEDGRQLLKHRPQHAAWLLEACLANLESDMALSIVARLVPCCFLMFSDSIPAPEALPDLQDLVFRVSQHCLLCQLAGESMQRVFVLCHSQTLFSKLPCVDRTRYLDVALPTGLFGALPARGGAGMQCLAILSDLKPHDFAHLAAAADGRNGGIVRTIKDKLVGRRDIVPAIIVLFRLCEEDVLPGLMDSVEDFVEIVLQLVQLVAEHCHSGQKDTSLVQLCTVVLLCLSGNRRLAVALNTPPKRMDLVIKSICTFLREGDALAFSPVQRLCLVALGNLSFYIRALSMPSATALVSLFERLVKCNQMDNATLVVAVFSNMLQYQSQGNANLVYCLLRAKPVFDKLHRDGGNEDLDLCALALDEVSAVVQGKTMDEILVEIASVSLVGALPVPKPMLVSKYQRSDKIDQVVRKCFWMDLYQNNEEYWDFWTSV